MIKKRNKYKESNIGLGLEPLRASLHEHGRHFVITVFGFNAMSDI